MFLDGVILENPTYDRVISYYASAKEVETLPLKEYIIINMDHQPL